MESLSLYNELNHQPEILNARRAFEEDCRISNRNPRIVFKVDKPDLFIDEFEPGTVYREEKTG